MTYRDPQPPTGELTLQQRQSLRAIALKEKIALIEEIYSVDYKPAERDAFDHWLEGIPEHSLEKPIPVAHIDDILGLLPSVGNYGEEKVNIFFTKEMFSPEDLQSILEGFSEKNPVFEISIVKMHDALISIGIGGKIRNRSTNFDGDYFGHYHPTQFEFENKDELPGCFRLGLMPSAGDIKGYLNHKESVKMGTRIFSRHGYTVLKYIGTMEGLEHSLMDFSQKYFDLFLGKNMFGLKSDEDIANYFKNHLGFEIEFHYR